MCFAQAKPAVTAMYACRAGALSKKTSNSSRRSTADLRAHQIHEQGCERERERGHGRERGRERERGHGRPQYQSVYKKKRSDEY